MTGFKLRKLEALCFRYPQSTPVVTSFGRMNDRPALFVRAEDEDGNTGWGEVWCNFPAVGAEHRARLVNEMLAPMLDRRAIEHPSEVFDYLTAATAVLALQSGERGPFAQTIAGVDIAPLLEAASLLYGGSFVAERYTAVGDHVREHAGLIGGDLDPVVATIILDAAKHSAADHFADRERLDRLAARSAGGEVTGQPTTSALVAALTGAGRTANLSQRP